MLSAYLLLRYPVLSAIIETQVHLSLSINLNFKYTLYYHL
ncbi:MAG: hypothetical protein AVDCRST_MAG95-3620 [uncultured Adhaeribacter sp.]|uniref:Uncharacterized protein n=1 Tax=uncultured Adhaeribacter sp. TaxID=448109 RepID=A0A6J4JRB6_9BACT|nr:MAG: hypothetical protein AVDCRST_MAG95-3620 [uncultured Adhaeribacter sp.]